MRETLQMPVRSSRIFDIVLGYGYTWHTELPQLLPAGCGYAMVGGRMDVTLGLARKTVSTYSTPLGSGKRAFLFWD